MVTSHRRSLLFTVVLIIFTIFLASHHDQIHVAAMRPLQEDMQLVFQSLQRGPVPPAGGSPCTNIPGKGTGICATLNGRNFAGRVAHEPPAFPSLVMEMEVGVASLAGGARDHHDLSS